MLHVWRSASRKASWINFTNHAIGEYQHPSFTFQVSTQQMLAVNVDDGYIFPWPLLYLKIPIAAFLFQSILIEFLSEKGCLPRTMTLESLQPFHDHSYYLFWCWYQLILFDLLCAADASPIQFLWLCSAVEHTFPYEISFILLKVTGHPYWVDIVFILVCLARSDPLNYAHPVSSTCSRFSFLIGLEMDTRSRDLY